MNHVRHGGHGLRRMRAVLLAGCLLAAGAARADGVAVEDAWLRLPPPVAENAAVYLTIRNDSDAAIGIVGAAAPGLARRAMIHAMTMAGGRMRMQALDRLRIPPHGKARLAPGGMHLMLMGLKRPLRAGETVRIELATDAGGKIAFDAPVRDMRGAREGGAGR